MAGEEAACRVDRPLGHPARPLDDAQLAAKFRDCARHAANGLSPAALDEVVELVDRLERVSDVGALLAVLRGHTRRRQ